MSFLPLTTTAVLKDIPNQDFPGGKMIKKETWVVGVIATCLDCGKEFQDYIKGRADASRHAKKYKHKVSGEVTFAIDYDGRE